MELHYLTSAAAGFLVAAPVVDLAEALVHTQLLHKAPGKRRWFNRKSAKAHTDHHIAYHGAKDYYRNARNEHEVIHFSKANVATIAGIASVFSLGIGSALEKIVTSVSSITPDQFSVLAASAGSLSAAAICYAGYEFSHHYMHVIGARRSRINEMMGDLMQGMDGDGELRYSKPVLDDMCNAVEDYVDKYTKVSNPRSFAYDASLVARLEEETDRNREEGKRVSHIPIPEMLDSLTRRMIYREREKRLTLDTVKKKVGYFIERKIHKVLRASKSPVGAYFRRIDDHHFMHHFHWLKNNNVFGYIGDLILGTRVAFGRNVLEKNSKYYLCPNSAD